jgi:hypothetical protein
MLPRPRRTSLLTAERRRPGVAGSRFLRAEARSPRSPAPPGGFDVNADAIPALCSCRLDTADHPHDIGLGGVATTVPARTTRKALGVRRVPAHAWHAVSGLPRSPCAAAFVVCRPQQAGGCALGSPPSSHDLPMLLDLLTAGQALPRGTLVLPPLRDSRWARASATNKVAAAIASDRGGCPSPRRSGPFPLRRRCRRWNRLDGPCPWRRCEPEQARGRAST